MIGNNLELLILSPFKDCSCIWQYCCINADFLFQSLFVQCFLYSTVIFFHLLFFGPFYCEFHCTNRNFSRIHSFLGIMNTVVPDKYFALSFPVIPHFHYADWMSCQWHSRPLYRPRGYPSSCDRCNGHLRIREYVHTQCFSQNNKSVIQ